MPPPPAPTPRTSSSRSCGARRAVYPISITPEELVEEVDGKENLEADRLRTEILDDAHLAYEKREEELGEGAMRQLERRVLLNVIDRRWREHLYEMDYLKEGIGRAPWPSAIRSWSTSARAT